MIVKLLTEHYLEILSLKGGCRGSSESTHVKMPHCWKSHALAHYYHILRSTLTLPVFTFLNILVPLVGLVCVCVEFPDRNHVGFLYFKIIHA